MTMIRSSLLLYLGILLGSLTILFTPGHYALSQSILTSMLLSRIGIIQGEKGSLQFVNLQHCGKMVSVTAGHYVTLHLIEQIKPDTKLIHIDTKLDVAIFESLGPSFPATIARKRPELLDEVYLVTYVQATKAPVILKFTVAGFTETYTIYQGMIFFGASGSGLYDKTGAYLGPIIHMTTSAGFGYDGSGKPLPMQIGLAGGTRTDKLTELLDSLFCGSR